MTWFARLFSTRSNLKTHKQTSTRGRLTLESLEDRAVPAGLLGLNLNLLGLQLNLNLPLLSPPPSSLAGSVRDEGKGTGLSGVTMTLTGTDKQGHAVNQTTTTDNNGAWNFAGLAAGNYTVTETPTGNYLDDVANNQIGTAGGTTSNNQFSVALGAGVNGTGYVFNDQTPPPPPPSSLAGRVMDEGAGTGLSGTTVTLTGTDSLGNSVSLSTTTDNNGAWSFANLAAGNYTITETPPTGNYFDDVANNQIGTAGGTTSNNQFSVALGAGVNGTGYVFNDQFVGS